MGLQHSSGRVIALGRLMLASLFLAAILIDVSQPARAPFSTYAILGIYIAFAAAVAIVTWRNWWIDARIAGLAHAIDIAMFAVLVLLTESYTSPFFTFFIFVLLSAAIRWGWRATALSAILLTLIYLLVGLVGLTSGVDFDWQRFLPRTGQLVILSLILIWFGAHQRLAQLSPPSDGNPIQTALDESQEEAALRAARSAIGAASGSILWRGTDDEVSGGLSMDDNGVGPVSGQASALSDVRDSGPFLYDLHRDRAVGKDDRGNPVYFAPSSILGAPAPGRSSLGRGLAVPIFSDDGEGMLLLEGVPGLSLDHIDIGSQIAADIATQRQRHAVLKAAEESAEARSRLTLARNLHDSIVQFLAGAAFRIEAMKRSSASGRNVDEGLNELKQLMLQEQHELRSFIKSLRSGPLAAFNDLVKDLQTLCGHLSKQWDVSCEFAARPSKLMIPTRVRLDAVQLTREAVANAVRHAAARSINIGLASAADEVTLEIFNDGAAFPSRNGRIELPSSLAERVQEAGGRLDMSRGMGVTKFSISLPIGDSAR